MAVHYESVEWLLCLPSVLRLLRHHCYTTNYYCYIINSGFLLLLNIPSAKHYTEATGKTFHLKMALWILRYLRFSAHVWCADLFNYSSCSSQVLLTRLLGLCSYAKTLKDLLETPPGLFPEKQMK